MERLPNRYPKISQSHKVPLYKGLSLFYPKLLKYFVWDMFSASFCFSTQKMSNQYNRQVSWKSYVCVMSDSEIITILIMYR